MAETARARAFIATRLKNDPTLVDLFPQIATRIFSWPAPPATPYPRVRMELRSPGEDYLLIGGERGWANPLILVYVAIDKESTASIEPIVNRIDQLLHLASGTVTNGVIWESFRERPFDLPDTSVVPNVSRLGGEYRFKVSQTA